MLSVHRLPSVDVIFQLAERQIAARKVLFTHFASFTKDFDDFSRILDQATDGFDSLVISLKSRSRYLDQIFFWYHVDDLERAAAALSLPPLFSDDDDDGESEDCRVIDISSSRKKKDDDPSSRAAVPEDPILSTTEAPLTDWLGHHCDIYEGDVLVLISPRLPEGSSGLMSVSGSCRLRRFIHAGKPTDDLARNRIWAES